MKRKIFLIILFLFLVFPYEAGAVSEREELLVRIEELQERIKTLQEELRAIEGSKEIFYFQAKMEPGNRGEDVRELQRLLNKDPETRLRKTGPGSPGNETEFFGPLTERSVIRFQEKYRDEVLAPWGFTSGTGIVGATTRKKLNELLVDEKIESVYLSSHSLQQGDALRVEIEASEEVTVEFLGKEVGAYPLGDSHKKVVYFAAGAKTLPGFYSLVTRSGNRFFFDVVRVGERNFPVTQLRTTPELEEKGYTPEGIKEKLAQDNKEIFNEVLGKEPVSFYFEGEFTNPLDVMKNVGAYGNIRKSGSVGLQHLGVDLDTDTGDPVYSINDGVIAFARDLSDYGKTIIVNHGGGIHSLYLHLDKYLKDEGEKVKKGEPIAHSGNTGYSLAPHLHLSINIHGQSVDPLLFLGKE